MLLLAAVCTISLFGCADRGEVQPGNAQKEMETSGGEGTDETENITPVYPSEDAGTVMQESVLGYSMSYDPTVFTLEEKDGMDSYTYNTSESLDAPIYISVQSYADMDAETLAEGLVLQSGMDGVEVQDANFGAEGIETKNVYIEQEVDGVRQIQIFYAIPMTEGSLLVEIGSYIGEPEAAGWRIEEMLGTFTLL